MDKRHKITREEAIQILSTRDAHGVLCGYTSGVTEALDMAIEALSAYAEWIPCSERLPNDAKEVLVCMKNGWIDTASYRGNKKHWRFDATDVAPCDLILAWMPLPKPYREDGEV